MIFEVIGQRVKSSCEMVGEFNRFQINVVLGNINREIENVIISHAMNHLWSHHARHIFCLTGLLLSCVY